MRRDRKIQRGFELAGKKRQSQQPRRIVNNIYQQQQQQQNPPKSLFVNERIITPHSLIGKLLSRIWKKKDTNQQQIVVGYNNDNNTSNNNDSRGIKRKIIVIFRIFCILLLFFFIYRSYVFVQLSLRSQTSIRVKKGLFNIFSWSQSSVTEEEISTNITAAAKNNIRSKFRKRRRKKVSAMLPEPGELAPLHSLTRIIHPLVRLRHAPTSEYHVFSISSSSSANTGGDDIPHLILTNILMGLFDKEDEHIGILKWNIVGYTYLTRYRNEWRMNSNITNTIVSHVPNLENTDELLREFRSIYKYLILIYLHDDDNIDLKNSDNNNATTIMKIPPECSSTDGDNNGQQTKENNDRNSHSAVMTICFRRSEVSYNFPREKGENKNNDNNKLLMKMDDEKVVIGRVVKRLQMELPYFQKIDFKHPKHRALQRLSLMNDMQLQMRDLPAETAETKYGVRGGTKTQT